VALIDLLLPDGDGTDLIAELRRSDPAVKVVVLSADLWPWRVDELLRAGVDAVLDKVQSPRQIAREGRGVSTQSLRQSLAPGGDRDRDRDVRILQLGALPPGEEWGKKGSLVFRPREGVSPRQDTGRPGQPTRTSVLSAVRGGDGVVDEPCLAGLPLAARPL
jgi:CheY-like chemotaxis protein